MNWEGDIYHLTCGDYAIKIDFSPFGEFCTIRYKGRPIGHSRDTDIAKQKAEVHSLRESPEVSRES